MGNKVSAEETIRDIKRKTRRKYNTEEKIRIVLEGLRGEVSVAELCRREGINPGGRGQPEPVLQVEQGLSGSREVTTARGYPAAGQQRRGRGYSPGE